MAALTIDGLKQALTYIQDNGKSISYYEVGPKKGLMVTDHITENDAYHLRIVQSLEPRLVIRLAEQYTLLSLDGQELLHMLSDEKYLNSLRLQLQRDNGYSQPADVQVFKLLRKQLDGATPATTWPDVIKMLVDRSVNEKLILPNLGTAAPTAIKHVAALAAVETKEELAQIAEPEPQAAKLIKATKQTVKQQSAGA
ncbi:TPA: hypothetical protein PXM28_001484 [Yersinia enterocolitica]|nr:hypothetical protein [Yersinia enterocolitica]